MLSFLNFSAHQGTVTRSSHNSRPLHPSLSSKKNNDRSRSTFGGFRLIVLVMTGFFKRLVTTTDVLTT